MIAHRLSTIQHVNLIGVVSGGHIVQRARHEEVVRAEGLSRTLYDRQFVDLAEAL